MSVPFLAGIPAEPCTNAFFALAHNNDPTRYVSSRPPAYTGIGVTEGLNGLRIDIPTRIDTGHALFGILGAALVLATGGYVATVTAVVMASVAPLYGLVVLGILAAAAALMAGGKAAALITVAMASVVPLYGLLGRRALVVDGAALKLRREVLGVGWITKYPLHRVRNLRFTNDLHGEVRTRIRSFLKRPALLLDYDEHPRVLLRSIDGSTANAVVDAITKRYPELSV